MTSVRLRKQFKKLSNKTFIYFLIAIFSFMYIFPFLWMLSTALKSPTELLNPNAAFFPESPQFKNFLRALQAIPFIKYTINTLIITITSMTGVITSASLVAYAFARLRWKGRNFLFIVMLSTLMLPAQVTLIPTFIMFKTFGWYNTFLPLTLPFFFGGGAFNIFLLRQFYRSIPMDMSESAKIDGCSEFAIWWKIVLPLCKPILAAIAVFAFMGGWNDFYGPLIYLTDPELTPLALGLRAFQMQHGAQWELMMAGSLISMLPTLVLFFSFQKYFVEGITLTGIKG